MSHCLALVQDYSSEDDDRPSSPSSAASPLRQVEIEDEQVVEDKLQGTRSSSLLPSPLDAFAEITGPPAFLKHSVDRARALQPHRKAEAVSVVEAKPVLVVNTNIQNKEDASSDEVARVIKAQNPSAQDAAELLRMCVQCGVPKTFSEATGMVCPVCRDHQRKDVVEVDKKRVPKVKDREKSKRMRGQSSHATWKSETEMHLRQQFD